MDIGGTDIFFKIKSDPWRAIALAAAHIRGNYWRDAVLEDATLKKSLKELFVFRNKGAQDSWAEDGRTDENAHDMIYLLASKGQFTIVIDHVKSAEIDQIVKTTKGLISKSRWCGHDGEESCSSPKKKRKKRRS